MLMDEVKFGTSGLRGRVEALTPAVVQAYVTAFLQLMQEKGCLDGDGLLLGLDLRPSSPSIAAAIVVAARHFGLEVKNCGVLPTPALALAAAQHKLPAIMVTGSHIPADRNGLKFYTPEGEIDKLDEQAICQKLEQFPKSGSRFSDKNFSKNKKLKHFPEQSEGKNTLTNVLSVAEEDKLLPLPPVSNAALDSYKQRARAILPPMALRGMRIGIYQQSCVARDLLVEILGDLGAQIVPFGRSETFLSIDTEALDDETRRITIEAARTHQLDAIVSTDGDGDRPLITGSDGVYLRGDSVGLLTAQFLHADCVVTPVTSSSVIERSNLFKQVYRCRVGSPYVLGEMARAKSQDFNVIVGFEANGGVLLGNDSMLDHGGELSALATRDAMLPILAILGLAQKQKLPVQRLTTHLPPCFSASGRLENIAAEDSARFLAALETDNQVQRDFCQNFGDIDRQDTIDGLRLQLITGEIIHYRASGNAPELRCYSESQTLERADRLVEQGLNFANQHV